VVLNCIITLGHPNVIKYLKILNENTTRGTKMRAALYLRASTLKQTEEGYSLEYQKDKLISYADLKDWTIVEEYEDAGESGRTTKRPAFNRMVEDAQKNQFDTVLVYKLDRFSRSLQDLLNVINILEKHNVAVWSVTQSYDDSTPEGRLMRNMLGSFAQFESEMIGARVKDGMARRAKEGEWSTAPPYGYRWTGTLELIPNEVEKIEGIYKRYEEGKTMQEIADDLNNYCTTKRGGEVESEHDPEDPGKSDLLRKDAISGFPDRYQVSTRHFRRSA